MNLKIRVAFFDWRQENYLIWNTNQWETGFDGGYIQSKILWESTWGGWSISWGPKTIVKGGYNPKLWVGQQKFSKEYSNQIDKLLFIFVIYIQLLLENIYDLGTCHLLYEGGWGWSNFFVKSEFFVGPSRFLYYSPSLLALFW